MANIIFITSFSAPELDVFARLTENQLVNRADPANAMFIAESPKVIGRALDAGYTPVSVLAEQRQLEENDETRQVLRRYENTDIPIYTADFNVLAKLTGFKLTRGMLCAMHRRPLQNYLELCAGKSRIAILENVMNPTNVGAIFRSAAALHMEAVLLTPGCSDPLYRRASRVSMGTVFQVPWTKFDEKKEPWPEGGMELLKELGFKTAAMALKQDSIFLDDPSLRAEEKLAVILGTEGDGLASDTIADCDYTVMIPMSHGVDSLNISCASAVAFWELGKRDADRGSRKNRKTI